MNKSLKRLSIGICSFVICTGSYFGSQSTIAKAKTSSVDAKTVLYEKYKVNIDKNMTADQLKLRQQDIDQELAKLIGEKTPIAEIENIMSNKKVYLLHENTAQTITPMATGNSDVTLNKPSIWYDSSADQWAITAGGYWNNRNWVNDTPFFYGSGWNNIGKFDTVGFSLHDNYGNYTGTSCVSGFAYVTDHNGRSSNYYNPASNDYSHGVYFLFQDQAYYNSGWMNYFGDGFSCTVRYSSNFKNYHGNATTFYGHTWSSVDISSVTMGTNGNVPGATINFSNTTNRWPAYSFDLGF